MTFLEILKDNKKEWFCWVICIYVLTHIAQKETTIINHNIKCVCAHYISNIIKTDV